MHGSFKPQRSQRRHHGHNVVSLVKNRCALCGYEIISQNRNQNEKSLLNNTKFSTGLELTHNPARHFEQRREVELTRITLLINIEDDRF